MWLTIGVLCTWLRAVLPAFFSRTDWKTLLGPADLQNPPGIFKQIHEDIRGRPEFAGASKTEIAEAYSREIEAMLDPDTYSLWPATGQLDPRVVVIGCEGWTVWDQYWNHHVDPAASGQWHWWVRTTTAPAGFGRKIEVGHVAGFIFDLDAYTLAGMAGHSQTGESTDIVTLVNYVGDLDDYTWAALHFAERSKYIPTKVDRSEHPYWSIFSICPEHAWEDQIVVQNSWGWPLTCMHSRLWGRPVKPYARGRGGYAPLPNFGADDPTHRTTAIFLRDDQTGDDTAHIPTGVMPLPFIANTLFFACGLWFTVAGARFARSAVRNRQGRCQRCGHHLDPAGDHPTCPECGCT